MRNSELTFKNYLAYGIGCMPNGMVISVIGFYIFPYTNLVLKISPSGYATMVILAQTFNCISDPLIGFLSDRTETRYGKQMPWIWLSSVLLPTVNVLFFSKIEIINEFDRIIYYSIWYIGVYLSQTCLNIPISSLPLNLTDKKQEREKLNAYNIAFFNIGLIVGPTITEIFLQIYSNNKAKGYIYGAIVSSVIMSVSIFSSFFFNKSKIRNCNQNSEKPSLKQFIYILKNKNFLKLIFVYTTIAVSVQLFQLNFYNYIAYVLKQPELFFPALITILITSALYIIPIHFLVKKFGKRILYSIHQVLIIFFSILIASHQYSGTVAQILLFLFSVLAGMGMSATLYITMSYIYIISNEDERINNVRREGAFISVLFMSQKVFTGIFDAICGYILEGQGFEKGADSQSEHVAYVIRILISVPAIILLLAGFILLLFFPIKNKNVENSENSENYENKKFEKSENKNVENSENSENFENKKFENFENKIKNIQK